MNLRRSKRRKVNRDKGNDNSNAANVSNEESSTADKQNNSDDGSGSDEESIGSGDKEENVETYESDEESRFSTIDEEKNGEEEEALEEEESVVVEEDTSTMPSNSTQLYKIGTKISKVFFDELEGKLRPYIGTITSYGE